MQYAIPSLQLEIRGKPVFTLANLLILISIAHWLLVIHYALTTTYTADYYLVVWMALILTVYTIHRLIELRDEGAILRRLLLVVVGAISTLIMLYVITNFQGLAFERVGWGYDYEYQMAAVFIVCFLVLVWDAYGKIFPLFAISMLLYGLYGWVLPYPLDHAGLSVNRLLSIGMLEFQGILGSLTELVATWIALFMLYAGLLKAYGAFEMIIRMSFKLSKYLESGIAQTAVISSALLGSINGSRTANAGITGSITIPLMKSAGMRSEDAAAIEATASTLGQILPPVMGSAGFLMAIYLNTEYSTVMMAAVFPALIMVMSVAFAVHYTAVNSDIVTSFQEAVDRESMDTSLLETRELTRSEKVTESVKYLVPFVVLVYYLAIAQYQIMTTALYTSITMMILGIAMPAVNTFYETRDVRNVGAIVLDTIRKTIVGFKEGAIMLAPLMIIVGVIGLIVDVILATGVPASITLMIMELSGGNMLVAALIAMGICVLLGMGMPTVAAYSIVAILLAPTFINQFGVPDMAAHFFVMYAAVISGMTPPIASVVAVTSGIAEADFFKSCWAALKIFAPVFVLPVAFLYRPEIFTGAPIYTMVAVSTIMLVGSFGMIFGMNAGKILDTSGSRYRWVSKRLAYVVVGAITMALPSMPVTLGLAVVIVVAILWDTQNIGPRSYPLRVLSR